MPDALPASPLRRRWWLRPWVWVLSVLLGWLGWLGWRAYDYRAAVREAKALGFDIQESKSPIAHIRADWHDAFRSSTWLGHWRVLYLPEGSDLAALRPLLLRFSFDGLQADKCLHAEALCGLTGRGWLSLSGSDVKDLAPLAGLTQLQQLYLDGCTGVANLAPLAGFTQLQELNLSGCTGMTDLAPLAGLAQMKFLRLDGCTGVKNLAALAGLTQLQYLNLTGCMGLGAETVAAFKKSHPQTDVYGP